MGNKGASTTTVPPQEYTDLDLRYHFTMAGNAQIGNTGLFGGFAPGDDAIGRYYNLGLRVRF